MVDTELSVITFNNETISQDEKKVKLLSVLIEHAPSTISKERLMNELWPETIVSEASLSKLVSEVRKLFSQFNQENPIRTVHRKGYKYALRKELNVEETGIAHESDDVIQQLKVKQSVNVKQVYAFFLAVFIIAAIIITQQFFKATPVPLVPILWVDDNPQNNTTEIEYFNRHGFKVYTVLNTKDALNLLSMYQYQLVISDMGRNDDYVAGLNLLEAMRKAQLNTPFILYSSPVSDQKRELVRQAGGQYAIENRDDLYNAVLKVKGDSLKSPKTNE